MQNRLPRDRHDFSTGPTNAGSCASFNKDRCLATSASSWTEIVATRAAGDPREIYQLGVYDAAPDTSPPPADEPVVASGVWAKRHRQITPRCSRSQDPEDAIEDTSVVHPRNATWLVRQHRPYGSPFIVGEFVAHDSSPQSGSLNHRGLTHRKELLARPWFGVFGAGADINLPTILNETVENDPKQR